MAPMRRHRTPPVRRGAATRLISLSLVLVAVAGMAFAARNRAAARQSLQQAQELEARLAGRDTPPPGVEDYLQAVRLYDAVPRLDPTYAGCDDALYAAARLCRDCFRLSGSRAHADRALSLADWLLREYPASPLRDDALRLKGEIYADDLHDPGKAREVLTEYLKRFPRSSSARAVKDKLKALDAVETGTPPAASTAAAAPAEARPAPVAAAASAASPGAIVAQITEIRFWSTLDYTRVVIDLDRDVPFTHNEVDHPYRIYLDFSRTILSAAVKGKNFAVGDSYLDRIRVGQYQLDVARVVLDFKQKGALTVFTLYDPFRVVVDIRDLGKGQSLDERKRRLARLYRESQDQAKSDDKPREQSADKSVTAPSAGKPSATPAPAGATTATSPDPKTPAKPASPAAKPAAQPPAPAGASADKPAAERPKPAGSGTLPQPSAGEPGSAGPLPPPKPNLDGRRSLTRILGMKVGKIVIDPGHGGKDTGSIGYGGIREKDVTLAIAKKLKAELESRLNIEVLLTRETDVFMPLEQRTAMAGVENADLFISLHANASNDSKAAGIETFYLGLTRDSRTQLLAAVENASAQQNLSQLEDVIKKITMYEKVNESRDFATKVHRKMIGAVRKLEPSVRDRGVKKAPFVVLIGTDIPAILLEIGFISNKREAQIISQTDSQSRVAQSISLGIEDYLASLGTLARARAAAGTDHVR